MKTWKSVISAVLAGMMILSTIVTVGAANVSFTDTSGHWAKSQIEYLVSKDVLNGYKQSNGTYTFKPDGTVTRAEFVKMLDETFGLTSTAPINYSDVKTSDWFHPYFSKAAAQGYLLNYGTSVSPNGQLTREEATTLLVRYLGLLDAPKASSSQFTDYSSISSNFRDPVMIAVQAGLINGYKESNGTYTFQPKKTLTRAEALTILYRAAGAIYNTSVYAKDSGSADTNAVITRGGVTVSGLTLSGRVIITEGAVDGSVTLTGCTIPGTLEIRGASNVILDKCTINKINVDSVAPEITVSLTGGSKISSLTLDSKIAMAVSSGCSISDMTVNTAAKNVKVTGDGAINKISVYAAGFVSTMMPDEFTVAADLTANFAGKPYSGSSEDQASFAAIPYMTEENGTYYLNVMPEATGRVHFYFTNTDYTPSVGEFEDAYASANYKNNFYVNAGKVYSEKTFTTGNVSRYDYVVVQLSTNTRTYAPVIIANTPTSGTGFRVDPYFDGDIIAYQPDTAGVVYYYYSKTGEELSASQFQNGYSKADSAMRGSTKVTAGRNGFIDLNERYLENYPFVIVVLETTSGQYYKPVVVSAGATGFSQDPVVTTLGTIEFKTEVSGTMYYYYTKSDKVPTPKEFANNWPVEKGKASVAVVKNKLATISYDVNTADQYPYMVFCINENKGDYLTPYVLKIDYDTGFLVNPYVSAGNEVTFRTEYSGTVYWFMSRSSTPPTADTFLSEYSNTNSQRKGSTRVYSSSYGIFSFNADYLAQYPYIYIMVEDTSGNCYQPVMLDIKETTTTGFEVNPYCDLNNERVYFKTTTEGTLYYYFDRSVNTYGVTNDEFWDMYGYAGSYYSGSILVDPTLDYIPFDNIDTKNYPGIVLMFRDNNGHEYYPVYLSIKSDSSSSHPTSGVTVLTNTSKKITLIPEASGNLRYSYIGTLYSPSQPFAGGYMSVTKGQSVEINHGGAYLFIVLEMDGFEKMTFDLTDPYDYNTTPGDGSTKNGLGFTNPNLNPTDNGKITFTAVATVDGTVTMTLSNMIGVSSSATVKTGESFTLSVPFDLNAYLGGGIGQTIGGSIYVQLTDSDGNVYERHETRF